MGVSNREQKRKGVYIEKKSQKGSRTGTDKHTHRQMQREKFSEDMIRLRPRKITTALYSNIITVVGCCCRLFFQGSEQISIPSFQ